jgi:acetyl-CoA carboxylase carboxyl transferase subunit alpha
MFNYLDFEKPVADLEGKILELKKLSESGESVDVRDEIARLEKRSQEALRDAYRQLTPWQKVQVARHPDRPHCLDYVRGLFTDFTQLAGDRAFGEDNAVIAGFARFQGQAVAVLGLEKGNDTQSRIKHNFGSARPEGYRKAVRVMDMADRFGIPVVSLVDTAGAYPGIGAEERARRRPSRGRHRPACRCARPIFRSSSARAAPAALSRLQSPTTSICSSIPSIR